jgi:hypothetical protein
MPWGTYHVQACLLSRTVSDEDVWAAMAQMRSFPSLQVLSHPLNRLSSRASLLLPSFYTPPLSTGPPALESHGPVP